MLRRILVWFGSALLLHSFLVLSPSARGQQAAREYKEAASVLNAHTLSDGMLNDDSSEARTALRGLWNAAGQAVVEILRSNPHATAKQIDEQMCKEGIATAGCHDGFSPQHDVIQLGKGLYAVAVGTETGGTVFIIGDQHGEVAPLWSLADASVTKLQDPKDLTGAWRPDRTGTACREEGSGHKAGSCGPLYSELGLLPADDSGRPRFYVDAGYEQMMGATIGKQTSVWRWNGDRAELLWIRFYDYMIDQATGTTFDQDKGVLHIGEKGEFRTMYSCGGCIDRPLDQSVLITKRGIEDLGARSLAPELDRIDDLFWRLQKNQPLGGVASPQVAGFLRHGSARVKQSSGKIDSNWFSMGMMESSTVRLTRSGAVVCLETDSDFGALQFSLERTLDGGYLVEHVAAAPGGECPRGAFLAEQARTVSKTAVR